jgi:hypothetical protein
MDVGFETIGNATLICYDHGPVLATDPWLTGDAYFGSWTFSHAIPDEQKAAVRQCPFIWISHGHPDHLSAASLQDVRAATILIPDHVGGRIATALRADHYRVVILKDRTWTRLSDRVRICSVADYNQDAILLVDIGGRLVVNLNDATPRGWRPFVRQVAEQFDVSFLLQLSGFGDADMINLFDEDGKPIPPLAAGRRSIGEEIASRTHEFRTRYFVPFSSMHRYQRTDSIWANQYTTDVTDYAAGFESSTSELLPAYIRYDCGRDQVDTIDPPAREVVPRSPAEYGDDWEEPLEPEDRPVVDAYVRAIAHLERQFEFVGFRVGGEEHMIRLGRKHRGRGLTFEVPRHSLMMAVRHRIFDDLIIGNFMRTTLHGLEGPGALYPHFTPYVTKYADNGEARSPEELDNYFREYRRRAPIAYLRHRLEQASMQTFRSMVPAGTPIYERARRTYRAVVGG